MSAGSSLACLSLTSVQPHRNFRHRPHPPCISALCSRRLACQRQEQGDDDLDARREVFLLCRGGRRAEARCWMHSPFYSAALSGKELWQTGPRGTCRAADRAAVCWAPSRQAEGRLGASLRKNLPQTKMNIPSKKTSTTGSTELMREGFCGAAGGGDGGGVRGSWEMWGQQRPGRPLAGQANRCAQHSRLTQKRSMVIRTASSWSVAPLQGEKCAAGDGWVQLCGWY